MNNLKICSLNVRGLNNDMKHRWVVHYLKKYQPDLCLLQETYVSGTKKENLWASEWGNRCIFSNGTSNKCGVAILLTKKTINVIDIVHDLEGRQLHVKIKFDDYTYCISNIYAPNEDNVDFFESVVNNMKKLDAIHNILGGDFNVVRDSEMDRNVDIIYHKKVKNYLDEFCCQDNMVDIWRVQHPCEKFLYIHES